MLMLEIWTGALRMVCSVLEVGMLSAPYSAAHSFITLPSFTSGHPFRIKGPISSNRSSDLPQWFSCYLLVIKFNVLFYAKIMLFWLLFIFTVWETSYWYLQNNIQTYNTNSTKGADICFDIRAWGGLNLINTMIYRSSWRNFNRPNN